MIKDLKKRFFFEFQTALDNILESDQVSEMSEQGIRDIGVQLASLVGDAISKKVIKKVQISNRFAAMTDEEFETYLKDKYGEVWLFISLTPEEEKRAGIPVLTPEKIEEILKEG